MNSVILNHPSISKQHAVVQFRRVKGAIQPWLMDLESVNKTYLYSVEQVPLLLCVHFSCVGAPLGDPGVSGFPSSASKQVFVLCLLYSRLC